MSGAEKPTAGRPHSLKDVDLFADGAQEHWYTAYDILDRESPVHRIQGGGTRPGTDGFILTRYADIATVVKDVERFPPAQYAMPAVEDPENLNGPDDPAAVGFASLDNPFIASIMSLRPSLELWKAHRKQLTDPWVGPGAGRHAEMIKIKAAALIDKWIDNGSVEFVGEFSAPFPQHVMMAVLGFPMEDFDRIRTWGDHQVRRFVYGRGHRNFLTVEEEREQAVVIREFADYLYDLLRVKRAAPENDMISWLANVQYEPFDRKLTDEEIVGVIYGMNLGGLETTQYALVEQAQLICEHPGLFQKLKEDRSRIKFFVEEGLRLRAPTQGLSSRMTSRDEVFQGVSVPAGSVLHYRLAAGNLDGGEFEDPKTLKLDRRAPTRHLSFSHGPRSCPGQSISRLEQNIAWDLLLDRLDDLSYADDVSIAHQPGIMLGTLELKLDFKKSV